MLNNDVTYSFHALAAPGDMGALRVVSIGNERCWLPYHYRRPKGWKVEHLIYTLAGAGIGYVGEARGIPCRPSSILLMPKDLPYSYEVDPAVGHWEYRWVEYDGPWARELLAMMGLTGVYLVSDCADGEAIVARLFSCLRSRREDGLHTALGLLLELFAAAERALRQARSAADPTERRLAAVKEYILANVAEPIGVSDLARQAGMSRAHFSRVFAASVGVGPGTYLRRYRVNHAQKLLRSTRMTAAQVGAAVGYPVAQHFSTVFKQETGLTPGGFRRPRRAGG
ncbi:MAG: helix-turn-helix transcriptional regulator [Kiritimatiellae bacterium]|nr:helix-turn-helix transcriptional regulator [Kiritimatiellia bacterium]